jgi:hypothetical protein
MPTQVTDGNTLTILFVTDLADKVPAWTEDIDAADALVFVNGNWTECACVELS